MKKIMMNDVAEKSIKKVFDDFVLSAKAKGRAGVTIKKYYEH